MIRRDHGGSLRQARSDPEVVTALFGGGASPFESGQVGQPVARQPGAPYRRVGDSSRAASGHCYSTTLNSSGSASPTSWTTSPGGTTVVLPWRYRDAAPFRDGRPGLERAQATHCHACCHTPESGSGGRGSLPVCGPMSRWARPRRSGRLLSQTRPSRRYGAPCPRRAHV